MSNSFNLKGARKRMLLEEDEAKTVLKDDPRNNSNNAEIDLGVELKPTYSDRKVMQSKKSKEPVLAKTRDPEYVMMTVYIPKDLHIELKRTLLDNPMGDISDLVAKYLLEGLLKNGVIMKDETSIRKLMESKLK